MRRPRQRAERERVSGISFPGSTDTCLGGRRVSQGGPRVRGVRLDGTDHSPPSRRHAHMRMHTHPRAHVHAYVHTCACFVHTCPSPTHTHTTTLTLRLLHVTWNPERGRLWASTASPYLPKGVPGAASPRSCFSDLGSLLPASEYFWRICQSC